MDLELQLVPSTSFYNNVRKLVSSSQWKIICKQVYAKYYYQCAICNDVGPTHPVEAHEIWKYDDKNHVQILHEILALCPMCHLTVHFGFAELQNKHQQAFAHLMKVNNWSERKAKSHIKKSFQIWYERSQHNWKLDISHLVEYGIDISKLKL